MSNSGLPDVFVATACRLAGGGAWVPLALTNVRLRFETTDADRPVPVIGRDQPLPKFHAEIGYNGTGRLKGRWEVVLPGDPPPTADDLLPEASLPIEQRALQQRYTVIDPVETYLMPTGRGVIPGPDPRKVPRGTDGLHLIVFRVEATNDKEGDSETGVGTVNTGGVAGFSLPVLRYYVGNPANATPLDLVTPSPGARLKRDRPVTFQWHPVGNAQFYRLEVRQGEQRVLSAVLDRQTTTYPAPPWFPVQAPEALSWQVKAIAADGKPLLQSAAQRFSLEK